MHHHQDEDYMRMAIEQAMMAQTRAEVPVGAVIVDPNGWVVGVGANGTISQHDATAHAEIVAIRAANQSAQNYRLPGHTLYVTLEPCVMCLGAIFHARLSRVVYATPDPKTGACHSVVSLSDEKRLNHHTTFEHGVLQHECAQMLSHFFKSKRQKVT